MRVGSMADVPDDLLEQIKYLEKLFIVDQAKLKEVTSHFVKELEKGKSSVSYCVSDDVANTYQASASKVAVLSVESAIEGSSMGY